MGFFDKFLKSDSAPKPVAPSQPAPAFFTPPPVAMDGQLAQPTPAPGLVAPGIAQPGFVAPSPVPTAGAYNDQGLSQRVRPNHTRKQLKQVDIPARIGKEIRLEKFRTLFVFTVGFAFLFVGIFFVCVHYFAPVTISGDNKYQLLINTKYIPSQYFMYALMFAGLLLILLAVADYKQVFIGVQRYKAQILDGIEEVPYFMIRNYKALVTRPIYMNWIGFSVYILGGLVLGLFFAIRAAK